MDVRTIEEVITRANNKTGYPTVIFAAACNYGLNQETAFPARDHRVISVYAFDGLGGSGTISPPGPVEEASLGTLGCGVQLSFRSAAKAGSGTSYATPILAAIAANLLD